MQVTHSLKRAAQCSYFAPSLRPRLRTLTEGGSGGDSVASARDDASPAFGSAAAGASGAYAEGFSGPPAVAAPATPRAGRIASSAGVAGAGLAAAAGADADADAELDRALDVVEKSARAKTPGAALPAGSGAGAAGSTGGLDSGAGAQPEAAASQASGASGSAPDLAQLLESVGGAPAVLDPLAVAASARTPHPGATLGRALTRNAGALAAGALLGFASPLAWAFRRGARAAARRCAPASLAAYRYSDPSGRAGSVTLTSATPSRATPAGASGGHSHSHSNSSSSSSSPGVFEDVDVDFDAPDGVRSVDSLGGMIRDPHPGGMTSSAATASAHQQLYLAAGGVASGAPPMSSARRSGCSLAGLMTSLCGCGAVRLSALSDSYLRSTHKYAHVLVATQGRSWCDAAAVSWAAFEASGVDGLIDDDVTDRILLYGAYFGGGILSLIFGTTAEGFESGTWLWQALAIFIIGFTSVTLPLTVLEASVSSLFVTYAQVPETLAAVHPILFHRFCRLAEVHTHLRGVEALRAIGRGPRDDLGDDL